jgi:hypothetical protein
MKPEAMFNTSADDLKSHLAGDIGNRDPGTIAIECLAALIAVRGQTGHKTHRKIIATTLRQAIKQLEDQAGDQN